MRDPDSVRDRGFTLVELMIVVVIIAILAAIAIPTFLSYMKRAKTSEARDSLAQLYQGSVVYFSQNHYNAAENKTYGLVFPEPAAVINPSPVPTGQKANATWDSQPWLALNFQPIGAVYFSCNYLSTGATIVGAGASFTAQAIGDLDGDGKTSLFQRWGVAASGGEIEGPSTQETDPLE